jgi:peptide/nickel transport system substrate-binding protein
MTLTLKRRTVAAATLSLLALAAAGPAGAATPKDTLVVALAFDDIITLDPAEAFEISAGEIMGNAYDRLLRYDVADPSKLIGDLAKGWTVSADGKTFSFELQARPEVRQRQPGDGRGRGLVAAARGAAGQDTGLHPDAVRLHQGQRQGPHQADRPVDADADHREGLRADLRIELPDGQRGRGGRQEAGAEQRGRGDLGYAWLKTNYAGSGPLKIREWRANEVVALERNDNYWGPKSTMARVIYRHLKEPATQRLLLEKGDVDIARNLGRRTWWHWRSTRTSRPSARPRARSTTSA